MIGNKKGMALCNCYEFDFLFLNFLTKLLFYFHVCKKKTLIYNQAIIYVASQMPHSENSIKYKGLKIFLRLYFTKY